MGIIWSGIFGSSVSSHFLTPSISDETRQTILCLLEELPHLVHPDHTSWTAIESYLTQIPRGENILAVSGLDGYNLLQWAVGLRCFDLVKWILSYGVDVNRGPCSLPLHIAALSGCQEIAELLVRYGARTDIEVRMCYPGCHSNNCELRRPGMVSSSHGQHHPILQQTSNSITFQSIPDRSQDALFYAIDGDRAELLEFLIERTEESWIPFSRKKPLLYTAFERKAWNCVKLLLPSRPDEVNVCFDEYYPIHQAVLHDVKFVEVLLQCNVDLTVRTATQQLTVLHVLLLLGKKSAADTMATLKLLLEHGARDLINEADSLGNTPLHALIVRYALEELKASSGSASENDQCMPWTTWDMLHLLQYLLHFCAPSINRRGNSALACVLRHVRDWDFRFDLLDMLMRKGGDPNCVGRDGSYPLIVCLVPLLNKGLLHQMTHSQRVSYLNCVRILCKHGANPNCSWRTNLTPLHVLVFAACEYITMRDDDEMSSSSSAYSSNHPSSSLISTSSFSSSSYSAMMGDEDSLRRKKEAAFDFIKQVLMILLQHKLDPNVVFSQRNQHILLALLDVVQNARSPSDLEYVYQLSLLLIQFGADVNVFISTDEPTFCSSQGSVFIKRPTNYVS